MRPSWLSRAAAVCSITLALVASTAANASAEGIPVPLPQNYYMLVNSYTNQCLDVNLSAPETSVQQWPCWDGGGQNWLWKRYFDSSDYRVDSLHFGCLTIRSSNIVQAPCTEGWSTQYWHQVGIGGGTGLYELRNYWYNRCLEVEGKSTYNGARVVLAPCTGAPHQRWRMA